MLLKNLKRFFLFGYQKRTRGFSDDDTWNLDVTIAKFILPRLIKFREKNNGYPYGMSESEYAQILDDMIYSFDAITKQWDKDFVADNDRIQKGLDLFAKYYRALWW